MAMIENIRNRQGLLLVFLGIGMLGFLVPFDEIKDNDWDLSINRYKEIIYEEIEYAAPSEIIEDIETLDKERNQALAALKEMLG